MGVEAAIAALAVSSAIGGATSYMQAQQRNRAARRSIQSARESASVQSTQVTNQANQERARRIEQARIVRARALAAAGETGFAVDSGDVGAILGAIGYDTTADLGAINQNRSNSLDYIQSVLSGRIAEARGSQSSLLLSGFTGALGGFSTGLQLFNAGASLNDLAAKQGQLGSDLSQAQMYNVAGIQ